MFVADCAHRDPLRPTPSLMLTSTALTLVTQPEVILQLIRQLLATDHRDVSSIARACKRLSAVAESSLVQQQLSVQLTPANLSVAVRGEAAPQPLFEACGCASLSNAWCLREISAALETVVASQLQLNTCNIGLPALVLLHS